MAEMEQINKNARRRMSGELPIMRKFLDTAIVWLSLYLAVYFYDQATWNSNYQIGALIAVISFFLIAELSGLYRSWRGLGLAAELVRVGMVWLGTILILLLTAYALKVTGDLSRMASGFWFVLTPLCIWAWRILLRLLLRVFYKQGIKTHSTAIAGADETGLRIAKALNSSSDLGCRLEGFYDDRDSDRIAFSGEKKGDFKDLVQRAKSGEIDTIYITLPILAENRIRDLIEDLSDTTASVYVAPDFFISNVLQGRWSSLNEMEVVSVYDTPFTGVDGLTKRLQDILISSVVLLLISLPMLLIAIGVKLSSPGPVLFKQRRYGLDGSEILVWKFRTMRVCEDGDVVKQACKNDPRVTPFGAILRRTSLDELPQFINVLLGEMSIVGPRPHAVAHNELYRELIKGYMMRHKVKPGITGWAQINGWRGETEDVTQMKRRVEHDLWYIRNWSFWLDMKIFFLTLYKGFSGRQAY